MKIRRMTAEDVPQVVSIEREAFSRPWSAQGFLDSLSLPGTIFLAAEEVTDRAGDYETVITGYIGMYVSFEEGEITNVAVRNDFRGDGIGSALVAAMQKAAVETGVKRIVLEVRASNSPAIHVYEKMGFRNLGIRKDFYDLPREDALIMEWKED